MTTTLQFYVAGSSGRQALTSVRESTSASRGSRVSVQVGFSCLAAAAILCCLMTGKCGRYQAPRRQHLLPQSAGTYTFCRLSRACGVSQRIH